MKFRTIFVFSKIDVATVAYSAISKQHKPDDVGKYKDEHLSTEEFSLVEMKKIFEILSWMIILFA